MKNCHTIKMSFIFPCVGDASHMTIQVTDGKNRAPQSSVPMVDLTPQFNHKYLVIFHQKQGAAYGSVDLPINNGTITWPQAGQLLETDAADADAEFHHEELPMLFPTGAPEARWAWSPWSPAVVTSSTRATSMSYQKS